MPHRSSEYVDYCTECDEQSTNLCTRCGRFLCDLHKPEENKRCTYCEEHYALVVKEVPFNTEIETAGPLSDFRSMFAWPALFLALPIILWVSNLGTVPLTLSEFLKFAFVFLFIPLWAHYPKIKSSVGKKLIDHKRRNFLKEKVVLQLKN